jgi:hypothetical protein
MSIRIQCIELFGSQNLDRSIGNFSMKATNRIELLTAYDDLRVCDVRDAMDAMGYFHYGSLDQGIRCFGGRELMDWLERFNTWLISALYPKCHHKNTGENGLPCITRKFVHIPGKMISKMGILW